MISFGDDSVKRPMEIRYQQNYVHVYFVNFACKSIMVRLLIMTRRASFLTEQLTFLHVSGIQSLVCLRLILLLCVQVFSEQRFFAFISLCAN